MDNTKKILKVAAGSAFMFLFSIVPALAFDGATLSEIKISSKDNYSYKILLKTNKDVRVQKNTVSDSKVVIDLDNTRPAEFVNTIYNNAPEIDNVIVQPLTSDKVRVFIEGLNISSSKVILDSRSEAFGIAVNNNISTSSENIRNYSSTENNQISQAEIPVNKEIKKEEEIPVISLSDYPISKKDSVETNSIPEEDNLLLTNEDKTETAAGSILGSPVMKKIFSRNGFDWILRIFAGVFIVIGAIKLFSKSKNVTVELSSATDNLKLKELELYRAANERKELLSKSIGSNNARENYSKKQTYGANSHYGIKEYQNSQVPPVKLNRPVDINEMKISPRHQSFVKQYNDFEDFAPKQDINAYAPQINNSSELLKQNSAKASNLKTVQTKAPAVKNTKINQKEIKTARTQADNIQFLETMASIYEKSGRADLAQSIKQSIIKSKSAA